MLAVAELDPLVESAYFWVTPLDDHLLVLDFGRNELHLLNPAAALLFLLLDQGAANQQALLAAYQAYVRNGAADTPEHIDATLQRWRSIHWLDNTSPSLRLRRDRAKPACPFAGRATLLAPTTTLPSAGKSSALCIRLQSAICCHIDLRQTATNHYPDAIPRLQALLSGLTSATTPTISLTFLIDGKDIYIQTPDYLVHTRDESFGLSALATAILHHSYQSRSLFATLHAAALSHHHRSLILPGVSGSGKSTLAAYLAAQGWAYLGDDVIALGRAATSGQAEVLAFCTAVGLKPGSWPLLQPWYPNLMALPVIPYADRKARFIPLGAAQTPGDALPVGAVVLPRYRAGAATALQQLDNALALSAMIDAGLTTGLTLAPANVQHLIDFIRSTPCYQLEYSDLASAEASLKALCHAA